MIFLYQFLLQIIWLLKPLFRFFPHTKVQYFFKNEGQIQAPNPVMSKPIWIHASSGEIEYAKSLIRELKKQFPEVPLLVTHTSISSEKAVGSLAVNAWGVAPLDTPQDIQNFLNHWNPRACLIARTDLWPQTLIELSKAKIPTYLFSATFAKGSKKISAVSRQLLKRALPLLKKIYFVSADDEEVCRSFFSEIRGQIMGDTRYDQVFFRLKDALPISLPAHEKILIAGSTWSEDEAILIPAFQELKKSNWKLILVPHEVDTEHIKNVESLLQQSSLSFFLSSENLKNFSWEKTDVLLVNQMGLLASLYSKAQIAFIGGSFKRQVHSVMEALATNSPVVVGPFYENNREALEFKKLGFVTEVHDSAEFIQAVKKWENEISNIRPRLQTEMQRHLGATEKIILDLKAEGLFAETLKT